MNRILMIEDDPDYCEVIGRLLTGFFDVCFESTLAGGISQMEQREPDAVLLDLTLPDSDKDVSKTISRVKLHRKCAAIVVLSGNSCPDTIYDSIRHNASGYLIKGKDDADGASMAKEINKAIESQRFCNAGNQTIEKLKGN